MLRTDDIGPDAADGNSPMARALGEAAAAGEAGEVPVGAVLVDAKGASSPPPATGSSATMTRPRMPRCWSCGPVRRGSG